MSSATPRRHLSKVDKLAIIKASKSPGFSKEEAMKKWGIRRTQMYDLLKNKKVLETKLIESPVRSYTGSDNEDDFNDFTMNKGFTQYDL